MNALQIELLSIPALVGMHRPRDIVQALSQSLAAKIKSVQIDSSRMKLGKRIGTGKRFFISYFFKQLYACTVLIPGSI